MKSYQVLARKWRPRSLKEMVGQEHILQMLTNALTHQRLHHTYLLTGIQGVGKTTLARILAKCVNCETGITPTPCETCGACTAINAGRFLDLIEIDAASRTKVEDTRELLDNVQYAPSMGRYKVYLIDEVHMLSGHSFNALLKTLEEPPAHVIFLLATTDPKRLPITILSRCLQFNLKRVPVEQISAYLAQLCESENIPTEKEALEQLAEAANGSMRDSLSLLDQAIIYGNHQVLTADVLRMLGNVEAACITRLLQALANNDGNTLLTEIQQLAELAPDYQQVLAALISRLHAIAVQQTVGKTTTSATAEFATLLTPEDVQLYYQIALLGRRDLPLAPNPKEGFEMVLLRMLAFKPKNATPQKVFATAARATAPTATASSASPTAKAPVKQAVAAVSSAAVTEWTQLLGQLNLSGMTQALASNCALISFANDHLELALSKKHEPMLSKKLEERIQETLTTHFGKPIHLTIKVSGEELQTSAKLQAEVRKEKQDTAVTTITQDDQVHQIMNMFDATLDLSSIKPVTS